MKTTYKNFALSSVYKGDKAWNDGGLLTNYNNHTITVKNLETGLTTRFEFWESISEIEIKTENQLLFAFRCFIEDAIFGSYDIQEFFDELGYTNIERGLKTYKGYVNAKRRLTRILGGNFGLAYDILNQMSEDGIE